MTKFEIGGHQSKEFIQSPNIIIDIDVAATTIIIIIIF